jgi:hypothetical protein
MKKIFLLAACALFSNSLFSQQWDGGTNTTDFIYRYGKVSVGASSSLDMFNVGGDIRLDTSSGSLKFGKIKIMGLPDNFSFIIKHQGAGLYFSPSNNATDASGAIYTDLKTFNISQKSKVGIGTDTFDCSNCSEYRLFVKDGIKTERIKVEIAANNGWADYVFNKDYKLMPLNDLQAYISDKGHLPEVPTTEEAIANGIELKEMNILLLKKVEELTLYLIDQNKINQNQKTELESNRREIDDMKNKLNSLLTNQNNLSNNK